jgi:hypothetical protein
MNSFYEDRFSRKPKEDPMAHLKKFSDICKTLKMRNTNNNLKPLLYRYLVHQKNKPP